MAEKRKTPRKTAPRKKKDTGGGGDEYGGGGDGDGREPDDDGFENHELRDAFLAFRAEGGTRPSARAFACAFTQFQSFPGAVRGKPAFMPPAPSDPGDRNDDQEDAK